MSGYHMASLHSKHSKQLNLPLGARWGVPEGTSVADCLTWNWATPSQPSHPPTREAQFVLEETTSNAVYVTPTSVDIDIGPTPAPPLESPVVRVVAPTPKQMSGSVVKAPTPYPPKASKCSHPHHQAARKWVMTGRQSVRDRPSTPAAVRSVTPAPLTVTRRYGATNNGTTGRACTPQSCRQNSVNMRKKKREPTPPPLTFQEYRQETGHPLISGRATPPILQEKFGSYPHYKASSYPDDVEYIVRQTKSLKVRTPTPSRPASQNGFNPRLLAPRTADDDAKENAMLQAIRNELHSSRGASADPQASMDLRASVDLPASVADHSALVRATSPRPMSRCLSVSQVRPVSRCQSVSRDRPRSSNNQLELVREKKTVGFLDENEYYRYLTYLEDRYGADKAQAPSRAQHFNSWRGGSAQAVKKSKPSLVRSRRMPGADSPGKVNVEMDCPENSDMTISLTVRNTPTASVY